MFSGSNWSRVGAGDEILWKQQLGTECILNKGLSLTFLSRATLRKDTVIYLIRIWIQNADYTLDPFCSQENISIILLEVWTGQFM